MNNTTTNELVMMGARVPRVLRRQAKRKAEDTGRTLARYIEDLVRADLRPAKRGSGADGSGPDQA